MKANSLVRRGLFYYWRTNLAVIAGVATAVAVLAGALLVGPIPEPATVALLAFGALMLIRRRRRV